MCCEISMRFPCGEVERKGQDGNFTQGWHCVKARITESKFPRWRHISISESFSRPLLFVLLTTKLESRRAGAVLGVKKKIFRVAKHWLSEIGSDCSPNSSACSLELFIFLLQHTAVSAQTTTQPRNQPHEHPWWNIFSDLRLGRFFGFQKDFCALSISFLKLICSAVLTFLIFNDPLMLLPRRS